ncbi:hypothetical protein [uncultured Citricoccus sp.]|uniref:hypothetical protein n=1 Tax=uncultured Citricoccus sp. TaxID=614031 RepID=UPI00262B71E1|nr:hypothetical protein [uncultured Citricoccus sp.]
MELATELVLGALNLVLALAAVVLALLAYDVSRARHPFTMSDAVAGVAVLTYNHIRPVWVDEVWVHHWKGLPPMDGKGAWDRWIQRDEQVAVDCSEISPGNYFVIQYRRKPGKKERYWTAPLRVVD